MDEQVEIQWHKLVIEEENACDSSGIQVASYNGKKVCLYKFRGNWLAFAYLCPHAGGLLAEGEVNAKGEILCPVHGYRFNLRTGYNSTGEGYYLPHWPVEERPDGLYIRLNEKTG
jgi:3-phenylpropionate/trans-cinnamate dioxygenase ferredoxin subunit